MTGSPRATASALVIGRAQHRAAWPTRLRPSLTSASLHVAGAFHGSMCAASQGGSGTIKAYSDELSQLTAGANGAHRMKGALKIVQLDWLTKSGDGTVQRIEAVLRSAPSPVFKALEVASMTVSADGHVAATITGNISDPLEGIISDRSGDLTTLTATLSDAFSPDSTAIPIGIFTLAAPTRTVDATWAPYGDPQYAFNINLSFSVTQAGRYCIDLNTNPNACRLTANTSITFDIVGIPGAAVVLPQPPNASYENFEAGDTLTLKAPLGISTTTADAVQFAVQHLTGLLETYDLTETVADSQIFTGSGVRGSISLTIPDAVSLSPYRRDTIISSLTITRTDSVIEQVSAIFLETGNDTKVFEYKYVKFSTPETLSLDSVTPSVEVVNSLFRPVLLKITGPDLPTTLPLTINGSAFTMRLRDNSYVPVDDANKVLLFLITEKSLRPPQSANVLPSSTKSMSIHIGFPGNP